MKIFQIGFNKCGTRYLSKIFADLGYKGIYHDHGQLARKMFHNFLNCNRLLDGYDDYEYYGGMENVYMNLYAHMLFFKYLDTQYPGSKFILNTRNMERWIERRLEQPGFIMEYLWSSGISCTQVALMKWKELWKRLHKEALQYFGDERLGKDLIVFDVEKDHPKKLFLFLSDKDTVKFQFQKLVQQCQSRFTQEGHSYQHLFANCKVYCVFLPERKNHVLKTLCDKGFHKCLYFQGLVPSDLSKDDYDILSTTNLFGPPISDCDLCSHNHWHPCIYGKPCKFCVHVSYLMCLYHAIQHSELDYLLVFEDDIYFKGSDNDLRQTYNEFVSSGFDVLYLGFGHCKEGYHLKPHETYRRLIPLPMNQSIICKHAIVYKKSYIEKVFWDFLPQTECSDVHFNHTNIINKARVCIPKTPFVFQDRRAFGSFNQNEEEQEIPLF